MKDQTKIADATYIDAISGLKLDTLKQYRGGKSLSCRN